jgi:hypothetical protein
MRVPRFWAAQGRHALCYQGGLGSAGTLCELSPVSRTCGSSRTARCRAHSSITPKPAPIPSKRCTRTAPISSASHCASVSFTMSAIAAPRPAFSANRPRYRWRWRRSDSAACSMATARFLPAGRLKPPAFRSRCQPCRSARSKTSPARSKSRSGFSSMS